MGALISRLFWEKAAPRPPRLPLGFALLMWAPLAIAQNNLGDLLDSGAKMLSAEEFKEQVVQRVIVGPTPTGGDLEVMYTTNGLISGKGTHPLFTGIGLAPISGEWKIDDNGRICTSVRVGGVMLPPRCQLWFKYDGQYFISDSDSDRSARVLRRTLKR